MNDVNLNSNFAECDRIATAHLPCHFTVWIIARIAALITSGSDGHATTNAASSASRLPPSFRAVTATVSAD